MLPKVSNTLRGPRASSRRDRANLGGRGTCKAVQKQQGQNVAAAKLR